MKFQFIRFLNSVWLFLSDGILILISFLLAYYFRAHSPIFEQTRETPFYPYLDLIPFVLIITLFCFQLSGVYRVRKEKPIDQIPNLFWGLLLSTLILVFITFSFRMYPYSRIIFLLYFLSSLILLIIWRGLLFFITQQFRRHGIGLTPALIIGPGPLGQSLSRELNHPELTGYRILGFVNDKPGASVTSIQGIPVLGDLDSLPKIIMDYKIHEIFISIPDLPSDKIAGLSLLSTEFGIRLNLIPDLSHLIASRAKLIDFQGIPLIRIEEKIFFFWNRFIKRCMDIGISVVMMILSLPITLPVCLLIRYDRKSPGPVFFKQDRIGKQGRRFGIYKFRSMVIGAEKNIDPLTAFNIAKGPIFKIPDDPRITNIGRFIRRWSIDELPQLWNVIKNEMSLVGPRPPLPEEVEKYLDWQKKRLEIQPGITGLWQVSGRMEYDFDEMVKLDLYYIERWSIWMDIKILIRTIITVIKGTGA